jgi:hypothetical protein
MFKNGEFEMPRIFEVPAPQASAYVPPDPDAAAQKRAEMDVRRKQMSIINGGDRADS